MWRKSFLHKSSSDDDEEKLNEESDTPSSLAVSVDDIDITEKAQNGWHFHLLKSQNLDDKLL
ncbi:hypothetical protein Tco_0395843, partial [Tanacetum coccineum]